MSLFRVLDLLTVLKYHVKHEIKLMLVTLFGLFSLRIAFLLMNIASLLLRRLVLSKLWKDQSKWLSFASSKPCSYAWCLQCEASCSFHRWLFWWGWGGSKFEVESSLSRWEWCNAIRGGFYAEKRASKVAAEVGGMKQSAFFYKSWAPFAILIFLVNTNRLVFQEVRLFFSI